MKTLTILASLFLLSSCQAGQEKAHEFQKLPSSSKTQLATFAGGCFWCMEPPFEKLNGVLRVTSGFAGGSKKNPSYEDVSSGSTQHLESVEVEYDPKQVSYEDLLEVFWRNIDPTDNGGQFVDRGHQYSTAIFYHSEDQKKAAEASKAKMQSSKRFPKPIVTPIREAGPFYHAEDYHQDYYKTNPLRYKYYRYRSGRDQYIDKVWGKDRDYKPANSPSSALFKKPSDEQLKKRLTKIQYNVTQKDDTEPAFKNEYWDNNKAGIYVDIVSGEPLFSSTHKYKSGTGWPSFYRPLEPQNVVEKSDSTFGLVRTEVRSKNANSHLGHVFDDGPKPTGLRYCINSASLRFVPVEKLKDEGFEKYLVLFENSKDLQ